MTVVTRMKQAFERARSAADRRQRRWIENSRSGRDAAFLPSRARLIRGSLRRPDLRVFERYADWCEHRRRRVPTPPRRVQRSFA
ncbi:MAG: hypothetical protein ACRDYA_19340, partial [Egibacteraceae bacterium]